jgi:hypothetical protein
MKFARTPFIAPLLGILLLGGCGTTATAASTEAIDITDIVLTNRSGDCADYSATYKAAVMDVKRDLPFVSQLNVADDGTSCSVNANDVPNYDFNDSSGHFASPVAEQELSLTIPRNPTKAEEPTELSMLFYNAVMLNGVVLDQLSDGCYKPSDPRADQGGNVSAGCGLWTDWRLDPMGKVKFGTDEHNAHTQPGGIYHYHGNPLALFDPANTDQGSPVIGFAADGFPIYGPHFLDARSGKVLEATSGYTLKPGSRPTGESSPGGAYDGTYIQDYEFTGVGTLDRCNGMTVNGQYGYYVTDGYPYVMACYTGTRSLSFFKLWNIAKWVLCGLAAALVLVVTGVTLLVRRRRRKRSAAISTGATSSRAEA